MVYWSDARTLQGLPKRMQGGVLSVLKVPAAAAARIVPLMRKKPPIAALLNQRISAELAILFSLRPTSAHRGIGFPALPPVHSVLRRLGPVSCHGPGACVSSHNAC